jgi:thioredoxin reductase (NADPH)
MPDAFIDGVTGEKLITGFIGQASRFCTNLFNPMRASRLEVDGQRRVIYTEDFQEFAAKAIILAQGLNYRTHGARGISELLGRGVHYGMPPNLAQIGGCTIIIVGGANSAGQAILKLASLKKVKVKVLVRRPLEETMSTYLIDRIKATPNFGKSDAVVTIIENAEVLKVGGRGKLEEIVYQSGGNAAPQKLRCHYLLFYIGAVPQTMWLKGTLDLDDHNFILRGRGELPFMTSTPGVFAIGDVASGSTKRIVNAAGEGGAGLQQVHAYLRGLTG